MIDREIFARTLSVFADRMGRALHAATVRAYEEALSPLMDTEQFQAAARVVFRDAKFWPEPSAFLEAAGVKGAAPALAAGLAFDALSRFYVHTPTGGHYDANGIARELGPAAAVAFRAIGGSRRLVGRDETALDFARKDFVARYEEAERAGPDAIAALPAGSPVIQLAADVSKALPTIGVRRALPHARGDAA